MTNIKKYIAEFIGTAVLVLVACGVAVWTDCNTVATALAFGLVIIAMAYSIGNVSGCHINPAVSFAMLISKKMSLTDFIGYVCAQVLGAITGAGLLAFLLRGAEHLGGNEIQATLAKEVNIFATKMTLDFWSYAGAFVAEVVLTFIFVVAILGVTDERFGSGRCAGLVIGFSLTLVHLLGLGLTGTSVNPARSIGPALLQAIAGNTTSMSQIWIWILAPLAGGALAAVAYKSLTDKAE